MNKTLLFFVIFFINSSVSYARPQVQMMFTASPPSTVFLGETVRIPMQMDWWASVKISLHNGQWTLPAGVSIEYITGYCPTLMSSIILNYPYTCYFNIVISGNSFGSVFGPLGFDGCKSCSGIEHVFYTPPFLVRVIPHAISMSAIPIQEATANTYFEYNLKSAVKFYNENTNAGFPPYGIITPSKLDGLRFDQKKFSIVGTPTHPGTYLFKVGAQNTYGTAAQVDLRIQVQVNAKDKPVFKRNHPIPGASPGEKYSLNLMEFIEPQAGFMQTNQISVRIDESKSYPEWLKVLDGALLEGIVPSDQAGKEVQVTLVASSNTGGDCLEPLTLKIPVAHDPTKKPVVNPFKLEKLARSDIYDDLSGFISDPAHDPDLKLILEKVEPAVTWLNMSSLNPMVLEGTVPDDVTGQKYLLTFRASTPTGGSSDPVTIPLQISKNPRSAPRFKSDTPILPMLYSGQPYIYDFTANNDVYPEYEQIPYTIKFAKDFTPPAWLRLEDNRLISDYVPENISRLVNIKVVIKNIPGGKSGEIQLILRAMK
ncbi:hypothetical protein [Legionella worsleiensis]|uniref:Uncharacterized protein n=1 Tax=Legionella worsleiensis TaxID=45076 RepID=A0A0W1AKX4_9GAMM|nr:hypothetical protein [Legionella worsleiensis]KTD81888.1 hypothetical protein Lwor_0191 [Legionella worsleiensis]STY31184.1 Uncharacterised protein [Legionella worsleiensis]